MLNIRLLLDEAITYHDDKRARVFALKGLKLAQTKELLGEVEYFKGQIEILNENFKKAIWHFDRAIRFNPKDGASYNDRALCMIELGTIDRALEYFDKGIKAEPDFATIYHNKGWLLNKLGRHTEAIKYFKTALKLNPRRAVTYENLADTLYNLGDIKSALKAYKKALMLLDPKYSHIKKQLIQRTKQLKLEFRHKTRG